MTNRNRRERNQARQDGTPAALAARADALALSDPSQGRALAERAVALARAQGETLVLAEALCAAGHCCSQQGEMRAGLDFLREAEGLFATLGARQRLARCLNLLGNVYGALSERAHALDAYNRSLELHRTLDDREGMLLLMSNVATFHAFAGRTEAALTAYEEALPLARALGNQSHMLMLAANMALLYARRGRGLAEQAQTDAARRDFDAAIALAHEALPTIRSLGLHVRESQCLCALAEVYHGLNDLPRALAAYGEALAIAERSGDRRRAALVHRYIGDIYAAQGSYELAVPELQRAAAAVAALGLIDEEIPAVRALALAHEGAGNLAEALRHFKQYHDLEIAQQRSAAENRAQDLLAQLTIEQVRREVESQRIRAVELADLNRQLQDQASQLLVQAIHLERHAHSDGLTGLANRRYLERMLANCFAQSRAQRTPLTVVLADIDHFKQINDRYSHLLGDEVLRHVARILTQNCRSQDLAARYGGEEFALVLDGCDGERAALICERIRAAVEANDWAHLHAALGVTLSLGYCDDPTADTPAALLAAADAHLYRAKQAGRNRISPPLQRDA